MNGKLLGTITGIVVLIVVLATFMIPAIEEAQRTAGAPITYESTGYSYKLSEGGVTGTLICDSNGLFWNGEAITDLGFAIFSDNLTVRVTGSTSPNGIEMIFKGASTQIRPAWSNTLTLSIVPGTMHVKTSSIDEDAPYSWIYTPSEDGDWITVSNTMKNTYVCSIKDIVASGYYSSGENDCQYWMKDGVANCTNGYTAGVVWEPSKVEGTTDIYKINNGEFKITIDEESFTPYYWLVKKTVTGHEENKTMASLYGILPLLAVAALVVGAAGAILMRSRD